MILHVGRHTHHTVGFRNYIKGKGCVNHRMKFLFSVKEKRIDDGDFAFSFFFKSFYLFIKARRIVIHGLSDWFVVFLIFQPWVWRKSCWIIWGWDLYRFREVSSVFENYSLRNIVLNCLEVLRKILIPRLGYYVSCIDEDFDLAREKYGLKGLEVFSPVYPSNFTPEVEKKQKRIKKDKIQVMVGNSATIENNHFNMFEMLSKYKNLKVYVPLSYGDEAYKTKVLASGHDKLGRSFVPLLDFMKAEDYLEFLKQIDIVCFGHKRQQGVGNLVKLIALGKKVYLNHGTTTYKFFVKNKVKVFRLDQFDLSPISDEDRESNVEIMKRMFSEEASWRELQKIFYCDQVEL